MRVARHFTVQVQDEAFFLHGRKDRKIDIVGFDAFGRIGRHASRTVVLLSAPRQKKTGRSMEIFTRI